MTAGWSMSYRRHGGAIRAYLQRRLASPEEAEDLCQETFLRVMRAPDAPTAEEPARLRAYLFATARNLLVNHLRRRGVVRAASELGVVEGVEELATPAPDGADDGHRARTLALALERELGRLPAEQREAFTLGALERWPYAEIAARKGWSLSKVKINVYRARKTLMRRLGEDAPGADDEMEARA
ncbi:MAG: RNA polymerase sigma factor [Candidatus Krumholzibacteriia bacterium]